MGESTDRGREVNISDVTWEKTNKEYLELQQDVRNFIASDAFEEDKRAVGGYTESLSMICSTIREGLLRDIDER